MISFCAVVSPAIGELQLMGAYTVYRFSANNS